MDPASRLLRELAQLRGGLATSAFLRYLGCIGANTLAIARGRSLAPADHGMSRDVIFHADGKAITVPVGEIDKLLASHDTTPTFGSVREMYAGNAYLRPFKPGLRARTVIDLGSNRGLFLMLALTVLEADLAIGVEPQAFYDGAFEILLKANTIDPRSAHRICAFIASTSADGRQTMAKIMETHRLSSIGFLKCDIEGGEFDVFLNNNDFLRRVDNIAMELHPAEGDPRRLAAELQSFGFDLCLTDQFGATAPADRAHYLYASRTGQLLRVS